MADKLYKSCSLQL